MQVGGGGVWGSAGAEAVVAGTEPETELETETKARRHHHALVFPFNGCCGVCGA